MNYLVAPDSFKECLDTFDVTRAISCGLHRGAHHTIQVVSRPLADGGEGISRVMLHALGGSIRTLTVSGPMGAPVSSSFALVNEGKTAVIEMASAAGLPLVPLQQRNPLKASTRGVGELLRHVLDLGVSRIVGLGAVPPTAAAGMAQALGVSLRDSDEMSWHRVAAN